MSLIRVLLKNWYAVWNLGSIPSFMHLCSSNLEYAYITFGSQLCRFHFFAQAIFIGFPPVNLMNFTSIKMDWWSPISNPKGGSPQYLIAMYSKIKNFQYYTGLWTTSFFLLTDCVSPLRILSCRFSWGVSQGDLSYYLRFCRCKWWYSLPLTTIYLQPFVNII